MRNEADWPRVSTILRILDEAYAGVPQAVLEAAAARGEALHRLCLSYLASLDGLCAAPVPIPAEERIYRGFAEWVDRRRPIPLVVEQSSSSVKYGYRGTPDALVLMGEVTVLLDLKFTASILRVHKVQMQAYRRLDLYQDATQSMLLHIDPRTGKWTEHPVPNNQRDWAGFLNALSVWQWRQS